MTATGLEPKATQFLNEHSTIWPNWPKWYGFGYVVIWFVKTIWYVFRSTEDQESRFFLPLTEFSFGFFFF